ncbi:MAG TPA: phosphoribosylanthranilate isomerase, partial [Elusimicrobiales bacterium]|nr:phosphoribosylanthranilate isomerase [Elusimicrobiales bacterium]
KNKIMLSITAAVLAAPLCAAYPAGQAPAVKVCGVKDRPSALAALGAAKESGCDRLVIGLLIGITHASREKLSPEQAADLAGYIRDAAQGLNVSARIACVTHLKSADELYALVRAIAAQTKARPLFDIIQIHDAMPQAEIRRLRGLLPEVKIVKALSVPRSASEAERKTILGEAVDLAKKPYIDSLLLDSANPAADQIGGTGITGDWALARAVIEAVHKACGKPVALAGGINPDNAAKALAETGADMLDANTGFRYDRPGGKWKSAGSSESAPKDVFAILAVMREAARFSSPYAAQLLEQGGKTKNEKN